MMEDDGYGWSYSTKSRLNGLGDKATTGKRFFVRRDSRRN